MFLHCVVLLFLCAVYGKPTLSFSADGTFKIMQVYHLNVFEIDYRSTLWKIRHREQKDNKGDEYSP